MAKFKRGDVVQRPDSWNPRFPQGKARKGRAIVMEATGRRVVLCTFQPGAKVDAKSNPHVANYDPSGLVRVGHVKKMPKACRTVLTWKKKFWEQHPFFKRPTKLK